MIRRIVTTTVPVPGYKHFLPPLRKLVIDYAPEAPDQHGLRCVANMSMIHGGLTGSLVKQVVLEGAAGTDGEREPGRGGCCAEIEDRQSGCAARTLWSVSTDLGIGRCVDCTLIGIVVADDLGIT